VRVVYGAPTLKHLAEFVLPTFEALASAPAASRRSGTPEVAHRVPNASYVHLFAPTTSTRPTGPRPSAELAIFDEAGFCPLLRYYCASVFRPSLLHSGGRTIWQARRPSCRTTTSPASREGRSERRLLQPRRVSNPLLTRSAIEKFIADERATGHLRRSVYGVG